MGLTVTYNPADKDPALTLSNGNLSANAGGNQVGVRATNSFPVGSKIYYEWTESDTSYLGSCSGIYRSDYNLSTLQGYAYYVYDNSSDITLAGNLPDGSYPDYQKQFSPASGQQNCVIGVAFDQANNLLYFSINGQWLFGSNPTAGTGGYSVQPGTYFPGCTPFDGDTTTANFSNATKYAPPTGYSTFANYSSAPAPTAVNATSNTLVGIVTSQASTRAINFVPPQNNYILSLDGNLLDPILSQVEANSAPTANGTNYQTSSGSSANVVTSVVVPQGVSYDGIALFVGPSGSIANTSQLFTASIYNGNTLVASAPATLNSLPSEQSWVFFKFATPVTSNATSYNWTVRASSESTTPVNVRGSSSSLAFLLRKTNPSTPALNSTLNVFVLGEAQGNTYINHTLTLNPATDTSLGAIVVGKGGTLAFPSSGTYNMRLYDGIYLYDIGYMDTGSNDVNLDQYTIYNAQAENIGRSNASVGLTTVVATVRPIASASSNTSFDNITSSGTTITSQLVAAGSSIGLATGQSQGIVVVSSAQNTPVQNLSSNTSLQVWVGVSSNVVVGSFSSTTSIGVVVQASSNTLIGIANSNTTVGVIGGVTSNTSIGLATSNVSVAAYASAIVSPSIDPVTSNAQSQIVVLTQGNSQIGPVTMDASGGLYLALQGSMQIDPIVGQSSAKVYVSANTISTIDEVSSLSSGLVRVSLDTTTVIDNLSSDTDVDIKIKGASVSSIGMLDACEFVEALAPITSNTSIGQTEVAITGSAVASATADQSFGNFTNVIEIVKSFLATQVSQIDPIAGIATATVQVQNITDCLIPNFSETTDIKIRVDAAHKASIGLSTSIGSFGAIAKGTSNTTIGLGSISGTFGAIASAQASGTVGSFKSTGTFGAVVSQSTAMVVDDFTSSNYTFVTTKATSVATFGAFTSSVTVRALASAKVASSFDTVGMTSVAGPVVSAGFRSYVGPFVQTADIGAVVRSSSDVSFGNVRGNAVVNSIASVNTNTQCPEFNWTITYTQVVVSGVGAATFGLPVSDGKAKVTVQNYTNATLDPVQSDAPAVNIVSMSKSTTYILDIVSDAQAIVTVKGNGDKVVDNLLPDVYISTINKAKIRNVALDNISSTAVVQFVAYADAHNQMDIIQSNVTGKVRWRLTPAYQMLI